MGMLIMGPTAARVTLETLSAGVHPRRDGATVFLVGDGDLRMSLADGDRLRVGLDSGFRCRIFNVVSCRVSQEQPG